jgi:hypothetical protein
MRLNLQGWHDGTGGDGAKFRDLDLVVKHVLYEHLEPVRVAGIVDLQMFFIQPAPKARVKQGMLNFRYVPRTKKVTSRFMLAPGVSPASAKWRDYTIAHVRQVEEYVLMLLESVQASMAKAGLVRDFTPIKKTLTREYAKLVRGLLSDKERGTDRTVTRAKARLEKKWAGEAAKRSAARRAKRS